MATETAETQPDIGVRDAYIYMLAGVSVATGGYLAVHRFLFVLPDQPTIGVLILLTIGVPLVMGYSGWSFLAGTGVGSLPIIGLWAGGFFWELTRQGIENLVTAALLGTAIALPVTGVFYLLGVAFRRDGTIRTRARPLALRMAAAITLAIALYLVVDLGGITITGDQ